MNALEVKQILWTSLLIGAAGCAKPEAEKSAPQAAAAEEHQFSPAGTETFGQAVEITNRQGGIEKTVEEAEEDEDLNTVLDQCGIDDLSDRNRKTFSTVMDYDYVRTIDSGIAVAQVPLKSILNLSGTLAQTTLDVGVEVGTVSGTSELGPVTDVGSIDDQAAKLSAIFRGPATAYAVPQNSNFHKDWKGILCSIIAANKLTNKRSGYVTESTYVPPFAPNVSPIAERQRYEKEIGDFRYLKNIAATVTATNNPLLTKNQVYMGSILVEKIPVTKKTPHGTVKGDVAYRITNNFDSEAVTLALGFHIWTEYYIDLAKHSFSAVIANVGDEETMYFIGTAE